MAKKKCSGERVGLKISTEGNTPIQRQLVEVLRKNLPDAITLGRTEIAVELLKAVTAATSIHGVTVSGANISMGTR